MKRTDYMKHLLLFLAASTLALTGCAASKAASDTAAVPPTRTAEKKPDSPFKKYSEVITDEASAIEFNGLQPQMVMGHYDNIKVTHPNDIIIASAIMDYQSLMIK